MTWFPFEYEYSIQLSYIVIQKDKRKEQNWKYWWTISLNSICTELVKTAKNISEVIQAAISCQDFYSSYSWQFSNFSILC